MNNVLEVPIAIDLGDGTVPIVMVDDEELDFQLVKRYYQRSDLSNPLVHYSSGINFIEHLGTVKEGVEPMPAVVMMDINMPRMNGFETVEAMRCDKHFHTLPVVMMMTSSDDPHDRARAVEVGADGYLLKPFNPQNYLDFFNSMIAQ